MPSFCKFIEMPVWSQSKNFCLQVQQTAAFDKLQVTILLLTRLCLGKKNQLDNKSVRGFGCFITLSFQCYCSVKKPKKWRTTSQLLFALTHTNQNDGSVMAVMSCTHYHCCPLEGAFAHFFYFWLHQEGPIRSEYSLMIFCIVFSSVLVGKKRN